MFQIHYGGMGTRPTGQFKRTQGMFQIHYGGMGTQIAASLGVSRSNGFKSTTEGWGLTACGKLL